MSSPAKYRGTPLLAAIYVTSWRWHHSLGIRKLHNTHKLKFSRASVYKKNFWERFVLIFSMSPLWLSVIHDYSLQLLAEECIYVREYFLKKGRMYVMTDRWAVYRKTAVVWSFLEMVGATRVLHSPEEKYSESVIRSATCHHVSLLKYLLSHQLWVNTQHPITKKMVTFSNI